MNSTTIPRFEFPGLFGRMAACGLVRIELDDGRVVVIATELADNPGVSITNFAEELAAIVCKSFSILPEELVWIEHYPADPCPVCRGWGLRHGRCFPCRTCGGRGTRRENPTFDLVTFKLRRTDPFLGELDDPAWRPMTYADWQELGLDPKMLFFQA